MKAASLLATVVIFGTAGIACRQTAPSRTDPLETEWQQKEATRPLEEEIAVCAKAGDTARLLEIARRPTSNPYEDRIKALAILELGRLRSLEATPFLVENIDFACALKIIESDLLTGMYPCAAALLEIGKPATPAILEGIANESVTFNDKAMEEKSHGRLFLLSLTLRSIEGVQQARILLTKKMEEAPADKRALFEKALSYIH